MTRNNDADNDNDDNNDDDDDNDDNNDDDDDNDDNNDDDNDNDSPCSFKDVTKCCKVSDKTSQRRKQVCNGLQWL